MNAAHFHLAINHISVVGLLFGIIFLLLAMIKRNRTLGRAALWILVWMAVITVPIYLSGFSAEEMAETIPEISEDVVHAHEELAETAFISMIILGLVAVLGLVRFRGRKRISGMFLGITLLLTIIAGVLVGGAANKGGEIRHQEIRSQEADFAEPGQEIQRDTDTVSDSLPDK